MEESKLREIALQAQDRQNVQSKVFCPTSIHLSLSPPT